MVRNLTSRNQPNSLPGALLVLFGGLAVLSSFAILGMPGMPPRSPGVEALYLAVVLRWGGLTVLAIGAGIFFSGLANRAS